MVVSGTAEEGAAVTTTTLGAVSGVSKLLASGVLTIET